MIHWKPEGRKNKAIPKEPRKMEYTAAMNERDLRMG
jgi:hypothetical protein